MVASGTVIQKPYSGALVVHLVESVPFRPSPQRPGFDSYPLSFAACLPLSLPYLPVLLYIKKDKTLKTGLARDANKNILTLSTVFCDVTVHCMFLRILYYIRWCTHIHVHLHTHSYTRTNPDTHKHTRTQTQAHTCTD